MEAECWRPRLGPPELAAQGTPQVHGGKFHTGFHGVPSEEQLKAYTYLQTAADLMST